MKHLPAAALLAAASVSASAAGPAPALVIGPDMSAQAVVNGHPARLQVRPIGSSTLILNADAAERFGLRPSWIGLAVRVGPVRIKGSSAVTRYAVNSVDIRHRVAWFERPFAPGFDGELGPSAVPHPVVIFNLRAPQPGERRFVLPLADHGYAGMGTEITVNGQKIFVEWALHKRHNGATAAAGATIAAANGGQFTGQPWQEPLGFGVPRPVRRVALAHPLAIGPVSLSTIVTRTSDYGDTSRIPDAEQDASEIVVTGKNRGKAIYNMEIGADAMAGCSSLAFDKPHRQIILTCR